MEIIKKELPLDILELFILTPLPGSEDHLNLWKQGVWMDSDLNKYDVGCAPIHIRPLPYRGPRPRHYGPSVKLY
jgi:hypothetical protein